MGLEKSMQKYKQRISLHNFLPSGFSGWDLVYSNKGKHTLQAKHHLARFVAEAGIMVVTI